MSVIFVFLVFGQLVEDGADGLGKSRRSVSVICRAKATWTAHLAGSAPEVVRGDESAMNSANLFDA